MLLTFNLKMIILVARSHKAQFVNFKTEPMKNWSENGGISDFVVKTIQNVDKF